MSLSTAELLRVARLARLRIDEADANAHAAQLSGILAHFAAMAAVDTTGVAPLAHALEVAARTRPDAVSEEINRSQLQADAPLVEDGYYLVPRVIE